MINKKMQQLIPAPLPPALKSPQQYLDAILKVNPAWSGRLPSQASMGIRAWAALWAAAVSVGNACRISEVLRITVRDLLQNGCAVIVGSKGSNARMIYTGLAPQDVLNLHASSPLRPLFGVTYREVWGVCAGHGFAVQEPSHLNKSVTHAGRYSVAQQVAANHGEAVAGQVLGHKSKTAVEHYVFPEELANRRNMRRRMKLNENARIQGPQLPEFVRNLEDM